MEFNLKRLLSFVVALVMVLTMVPFDGLQVFATEVKSGTYDRPESDDPEINAIMLNADRIRTESQTAYEEKLCPKCQKPVTWTILSQDGSIDVDKDANLHLYVPTGAYKHTSDKDDSGKVINAHGYAPINFVGANANVCVLLGGAATNEGRWIYLPSAASGSTVNIMSESDGSLYAAGLKGTNGLIQQDAANSVVNVYGGTFWRGAASTENEADAHRAVIFQSKGECNIYNDVKIGPEALPTTNIQNKCV